MKKAIVSAAFGDFYERMTQITFPTFSRYAERIKAEFIHIKTRKFQGRGTAHVEKFQVYDVLESYDVVAWVDCDALISSHACSIFDAVPVGHFAAVDEAKISTILNVDAELRSMAEPLGLEVPQDRPFIYFNSGVFVAYKEQRFLFEPFPQKLPTKHGLPEQTLLNIRVANSRTPFFSLPKTWNSIWCVVGYEHDHIIHFAGQKRTDELLKKIEDMKRFL
jgi:hypothetical protein